MKRVVFIIYISIFLTGCSSIVTTPIDVTSSVVGAGINLVGSAGGAVVNTLTGGDD